MAHALVVHIVPGQVVSGHSLAEHGGRGLNCGRRHDGQIGALHLVARARRRDVRRNGSSVLAQRHELGAVEDTLRAQRVRVRLVLADVDPNDDR